MPESSALTKPRPENQTENTRGGNYLTPRVDIFETDKELTLSADMPGVSPQDVELRFENGELILRGRVRTPERTGPAWLEYGAGDFYRTFTVHETIDSTKISAECRNGVLTVHLPKVEAVQPRKISVRAE
jgi:HSP20 family protein